MDYYIVTDDQLYVSIRLYLLAIRLRLLVLSASVPWDPESLIKTLDPYHADRVRLYTIESIAFTKILVLETF